MSGKRRHNEREAKREALVQRTRLDASASGVAVDLRALAPHNSYSQPDFVERGYYVDKPFECQACGISQTWSAAQQKWWYEVAKGDVFSTAKLCRPCRQEERARREEARLTGGDPNPYKNPELLLAKIRSDIEPKMLLAGYRPVGRNKRGARRALFLDYSRSDGLFTLSWDQHEARLAAELLTEGEAELRVIATAEFSGVRSTSDIEDRLAAFMAPVRSFLEGLGGAPPKPESQRNLSAPDNPAGG
jgi:hypothetical protein